MFRILVSGMLLAGMPASVHAQVEATSLTPDIVSSGANSEAVPTTVVTIKRDTPVELMAYSEISTADSTPGKRFKLLLNQPITVGGRIIAPKGTIGYGEVTSAEDSGGLGKSGRMTARLLYLKLGDVEIPLEGEASEKGTGAGSAGVAILFTGIVGLFHRGNNAKIKAGEILTGFVAQDVALDLASTPIKRASTMEAQKAPQQ